MFSEQESYEYFINMLDREFHGQKTSLDEAYDKQEQLLSSYDRCISYINQMKWLHIILSNFKDHINDNDKYLYYLAKKHDLKTKMLILIANDM